MKESAILSKFIEIIFTKRLSRYEKIYISVDVSVYILTGSDICTCVYVFPQQTQRGAPISQIYFWNTTLHVSDRFSVHHQESSTVYTAVGICHTGYADCLLAGSGDLLLCIQY